MRLEWRSERRGYTLILERDLFGAFVLHRRWFGLHNRRGGVKRQVFDDEQRALAEVERLARVRERHGYRLLSVAVGYRYTPPLRGRRKKGATAVAPDEP